MTSYRAESAPFGETPVIKTEGPTDRKVSGVFDVTRRPPGWRCRDIAALSGPLARTVATSNAGAGSASAGQANPSPAIARAVGCKPPISQHSSSSHTTVPVGWFTNPEPDHEPNLPAFARSGPAISAAWVGSHREPDRRTRKHERRSGNPEG